MIQEINKLKKAHPELSSLIILGRAVAGKNITIGEITRLLKLHVDKEDYAGTHRDTIIAHLRGISERGLKIASPYMA